MRLVSGNMKVKQIVEAGWQSQKDFIDKLKIRKKLSEYALKNDISLLYHKVHTESSPVFVLSTGRCGTAFLTNLLLADSAIKAFHEPEPEFFYHPQMAYLEYKSDFKKISAVFDVARYELIRDTMISGKQYAETNNRVTFFAYQIANLYPNSKFIHLIRNPASFVKSGLARNWYSNHNVYDEGRIKSLSDSWNDKTQIEKIAWLWNETNHFIHEFGKQLNSNRFLQLKSEDLFNSFDVQKSVFTFIQGNAPSPGKIKKYGTMRINEGGKSKLSESELRKIQEEVGKYPLRIEFGY